MSEKTIDTSEFIDRACFLRRDSVFYVCNRTYISARFVVSRIATPLSFSRIEKCATIDGMALDREEAHQLSPDPDRIIKDPLGGLT